MIEPVESEEVTKFFTDYSFIPEQVKRAALKHGMENMATLKSNGLSENDFEKLSSKVGQVQTRALSLHDFETEKIISSGVFGKVELVKCIRNGPAQGRRYALKVSKQTLSMSDLNDKMSELYAAFWCREGVLLLGLKHRNLATVYGISYDINMKRLFIVMELCEDYETLSAIMQNTTMDITQIHKYFIQLVEAIHFLHLHAFAHRDIKPPNILIQHKTELLKLVDFGCCQRASYSQRTGTNIGTLPYSPPEVFSGKNYKAQLADAYNVGAVLLDMLAGMDNSMEMKERVLEHFNEVNICSVAFKQYVKLVEKLIEDDPLQRLSIHDLLAQRDNLIPGDELLYQKFQSNNPAKRIDGMQPFERTL